MKKTTLVQLAITSFMVILLSTYALSRAQVTESLKIKNEENVTDTNTQATRTATQQTFNSDIQRASASNVKENDDKVDDSCNIQDEQTPTEMNPSQISDSGVTLPLPIPDGRIFLHTGAGVEDPIPYIPTENPKLDSRMPIVDFELDG